jgi:hypothetical protein
LPLITKKWWLACELDILFLRREPAGYIVDDKTGDLDNRLKVLFDALRIPKEGKELVQASPTAEQQPFFYCLLQDDSLITKFNIDSDRLLTPVGGKTNEVKLVVRAKVKVIKLTFETIGMGGD